MIFGPSEWKRYKQKEVEDVLFLYRDFETKKRTVQLNTPKQMIIKVPSSLIEFYERNGKRSISDVEHMFEGKIVWKRDKLRIESSLINQCFEGPVHEVICNVKKILSKRKMRGVNRILLVGGFCESPYVQESFRARFGDKQVIIPEECGLAVLKGAVLFGQNPSVVSARIARYTYGLDIAVRFDVTKHPREKMIDTDVGEYCKNTFWKAVEIGQVIENGHEVSRIGKAVDDFQSKLVLHVVRSNRRNPIFTTEEGCEVIGKIVIPMDSALEADDNAVKQIFIFGGTEFKFRTKHKTLGDRHQLSIDL